MKNNLPIIEFESRERWQSWLEEHGSVPGVWLKMSKKGSGITTVSYAEALEVALAYGWIDSQKGAYDDKYFVQKFTPRGPKSVWSRTNRDKAIELIKTGRMKPSGLRQVEIAKANGQWERAYESQRTITVPADLQEELDRNETAKAFFATLNSINRYAVLYRIETARKPETRKARIKTFVEMLARKEKLYP